MDPTPDLPSPAPPGNKPPPSYRGDKRHRYHQYFLAISFTGVALLIWPMMKIFFVPLIVAASVAAIFYPLYQWFQHWLWNKKAPAALITCGVIVICMFIPAYIAGYIITNQAIGLYQVVEPAIRDFMEKGEDSALGTVLGSRHLSWVPWAHVDWNAVLKDALATAAKGATAVINKTSESLLGFVINFLIMLFSMYYLFVDGEAFTRRLNYLVPLRQRYKEGLFNRFLQVSRSTVTATLTIGLIQGAMGSLLLLFFGIKSWLLWGVVMVLLSIIPMMGAGTVLIPMGLIQMLVGHPWRGLGILLISILIISNVDSLLRPRIVGKKARIHPLIVFFATIGGLYAFGIMGFIVGPVIAVMFVTVIDIYSMEFREYLDEPR